MRLNRLLKAALAVTCLSLAWPTLNGESGGPISPAHAAVSVDFGIDSFYDELSPYGDWVNYGGRYVFIPGEVSQRWRPYSEGHWVYTDDYGWLWVSDEPFGWATYHYGRWGYGEDIGWYWVPGTVWAPAWVSWRRSPSYVVWAPLPPTYGDDYYDEEDDEDYDNDIPDNYWNAVPAARFLDLALSALIYNDDDEDYGYRRRHYIDETEYLGPVRFRDKRVVNKGLDTDFVARETNRQVRHFKIKETDDFRRSGKRDGDEVSIFDRKVRSEPSAKPRKTKNIDEVKQVHGQRWKRGNGDNQEVGSKKKGSDQPQFGGQEQPENIKKRQQQSKDGIDTTNRKKNAKQIDEQSKDGRTLTKKQRREAEQQKKKKRNQDLSNGNVESGASRQNNETSGQSGKKKKRNQGANENSQNSDGLSNQQGKKKRQSGEELSGQKRKQGSDEFAGGKQKKNRNLGNADQVDGGGKKRRNDASGQDDQSGNNKKRKPKSGCDPNDGDCQ